MAALSPQGDKHDTWYMAVPIITNPVYIFATLCTAAGVLVGSMLLILSVQLIVGDGIYNQAQVLAAFFIGIYSAGILILAFIFIGGVILGNRYATYYEVRENCILSQSMRIKGSRFIKDYFFARPYKISSPTLNQRSHEKKIFWDEVTKVRAVPQLYMVTLQGKNMSMVIYFPDTHIMARTVNILQKKNSLPFKETQ